AELLQAAARADDVLALLPTGGARRVAEQVREPEAAQVDRGDVEAPVEVGADGDLTDVVEEAVREQAVDDDEPGAGLIVGRDGDRDPLPVGALEVVVAELARVGVAKPERV